MRWARYKRTACEKALDDLIRNSACDMVDLLQRGEIRVDEALDALAARIDAVDGGINALPTLCFERAHVAMPEEEGNK